MQTVTHSENKPNKSSAPKQGLDIEKFTEGNIACFRLSGVINEQFEGKKIAASVKAKTVVLDLSKIDKISSFGIREWSTFMGIIGKQADHIYLMGCTPKVVNQINMVSNFIGTGRLFSFYAPYRCDYCESTREVLLNVDRDFELLKKFKAPEFPCPSCGNNEYFDDDPNAFFTYVATQPQFELDSKVATFLISKLNYPVSDLARRVHIQKLIEGRYTYINLAGNLDSSFPSEKLAEGLEGTTVVDVSGVGGLDPAGAAEFRKFLNLASAISERICMLGCQAILLEKATRPEDLDGKVEILSFAIPYHCDKCGTTASQEIDVQQHYGVLKMAMPPNMKCLDCGASAKCVASGTILSHLPKLTKPNVEPALKKFIKNSKKAKIVKTAKERAQSNTGPVLNTWVVASVALIAAGAVSFGYYQQKQSQDLVQQTVTRLSVNARQTRPQWITSDTPFSAYCTDLTTRTVCVGVSRFLSSKDEARLEAGHAALEALSHTVGLKIDQVGFSKLVRGVYSQARQQALYAMELARHESNSEPLAKAEAVVKSARTAAADALVRTGGAGVPTQVADWYWEEYEAKAGGSEFLVFVRYDLSKEEMDALVQNYARVVPSLGGELLTAFPSLAWTSAAQAQGAQFVRVAGLSDKLGFRSGDLVRSVAGNPVHTAQEAAEKLRAQLINAEKGAPMVLSIRSKEGQDIEVDWSLLAQPLRR